MGALASSALPHDPRLPVPHPLDFDWRFTQKTVERFARELASNSSGEGLALLGTPSLWLQLAIDNPHLATVPWLLDRNPALQGFGTGAQNARARILLTDLASDAVPPLNVASVVADPPWYPLATKTFLWAAVECSAPNARVYLSTAPLGTRPGIAAERLDLIEWAAARGLVLTEERRAAFDYEMPAFEMNALAAQGLDTYPATGAVET